MGRRVLIDALAARFGGTAAATVQLARHLVLDDRVAHVTVVCRRGSIVERGLAGEEAVSQIALPVPRGIELLQRVMWEALRLPALARRDRYEVLISMSGMLPTAPECRLVCLTGNPVMYESGGPANALRRWAARRTASEDAYLAAPSRYMADMVAASVGRPCDVLAWGVDHSAFFPAASPGEEILCVGDFKTYKRHDLVVDAWRRLPTPRPRLRLVGNPDVEPRAHASLLARIESAPEAESIKLDYRLAHEQMPDVYRRARVFVIASEHESFCMPLAESMACGVPAIASDIPSLRETGGAGALYLGGDDPDEWAAAIGRMCDDVEEHQRASELAVQSAARFSWERFAEELAEHL
jgi:glycosyltransferase involved in cell wall biosynthesis